MRVLLVHPVLAPYRLDLYNAVARRCELRVVFLHRAVPHDCFDQDRLRQRLAAEHGYLDRGFTLRRPDPRWTAGAGSGAVRLGLVSELRRFRPDVVVTTEFSPTTLTVLAHRRLAGGPAHVVWTDDHEQFVALDAWSRKVLRAAVVRLADGLVVTSRASALLYRDRYGATLPIGVVPILHEEARFRRELELATAAARTTANALGLLGRRVLLFVGRLVTEKRLDRLIAAFARARGAHPEAVLALVGDGPERARLEALSRSLGIGDRARFAGRCEGEALHAWYVLGSTFALTSERESFCAAVGEALLAGMPVVCSHAAGASALVQDGVNGCTVDASRAAPLTDAITAWLGRVPALTDDQLRTLRPSLLRDRFDAGVQQFLDVAGAAHARRTRSAAEPIRREEAR